MSWNKTSRAQKEEFDSPMSLNVATQVAGVTLRNVGKIPCNVAKCVAESRTDFYFSQRLRQMSVAGMLH